MGDFMKKKILIVDDSTTVQKVISTALSKGGYELFECLREEDFEHHLDETSYDLIVLDFNLSEQKDGFAILKTLSSKIENTPLFVMFDMFDTVEKDLLLEHGVSENIIKPFDEKEFISKCETLLKKNLLPPVVAEDVNISNIINIPLEEWVVEDSSKKPELIKKEEIPFPDIPDSSNTPPLSKISHSTVIDNNFELPEKDWNFEIPPIIGSDKTQSLSLEIPPLIEEKLWSVDSNKDEDPKIKIILEKIRPLLKEMVKEVCSEKIETIAWEIIPDLAENLIYTEVQDLKKLVKENL